MKQLTSWFTKLSRPRRVFLILNSGVIAIYVVAWIAYNAQHGTKLLPQTVLFVITSCLWLVEALVLAESSTVQRRMVAALSTAFGLVSTVLCLVFIVAVLDFSWVFIGADRLGSVYAFIFGADSFIVKSAANRTWQSGPLVGQVRETERCSILILLIGKSCYSVKPFWRPEILKAVRESAVSKLAARRFEESWENCWAAMEVLGLEQRDQTILEAVVRQTSQRLLAEYGQLTDRERQLDWYVENAGVASVTSCSVKLWVGSGYLGHTIDSSQSNVVTTFDGSNSCLIVSTDSLPVGGYLKGVVWQRNRRVGDRPHMPYVASYHNGLFSIPIVP